MAHTPFKPLFSWLQHPAGPLNGLLGRVGLLRRLTAAIRDALPPPLARHCLAANLDGDTLVLSCDSTAWAAKLRYQLPQLLQALQGRTNLPAIRQIRVRVQPRREPVRPAVQRRATLSEHSAAVITSVADATTDPALKAALRRLGRHAKPVKKHDK